MNGIHKMVVGIMITIIGLTVYLIGFFEIKNITQLAVVCYSGIVLAIAGFGVLLMGSFSSFSESTTDYINWHYDQQIKRINDFYDNQHKSDTVGFPEEIV